MTNGYSQYNRSGKSRSCENSLDSCGRKATEDLTISSSSLIDLPISSPPSHADYDNFPMSNGHDDMNGQTTGQQSIASVRTSSQPQSPISSELDQKTKDAIDARLKEIDDEFESNGKK